LKDRTRINQQIRAPELRVITEEGVNLGVMATSEALSLAQERGLDLIEISPNANPPIAKIMDFGKYQYIQNKKEKAARLGSKNTETKQLQVKIGTGDHDLQLKAKKASEFLKDGHRVKIELYLRGRSKYLDKDFLKERLDRILNFITENYKIAEELKPCPNGFAVVIEKDKTKKKEEIEIN
jgi:translation initiation factor IF-3